MTSDVAARRPAATQHEEHIPHSQQLVADGAEVVVTCRKTSDALQAIVLMEKVALVTVVEGIDVCDTKSCESLVGQVGGPLDYVINNAGYFPGTAEGETLTNMDFSEQLKQLDAAALLYFPLSQDEQLV